MANCKYCNIPLKWKKPYTAGDRPVELNDQPHNCPKFGNGKKQNKVKWSPPLESGDLELCDMCGRWLITKKAHDKRPELHYVDMIEHIETFHPNGEILDDIDFMAITSEQKETFRLKTNTPKITTKYLQRNRR